MRFFETFYEGAFKHEFCKNMIFTWHWLKKLWCLNYNFILDGQLGNFCYILPLPFIFGIKITNLNLFGIVKKFIIHNTKNLFQINSKFVNQSTNYFAPFATFLLVEIRNVNLNLFFPTS